MEKEKDRGTPDKPAPIKPVNERRPVSGTTDDSFALQRTVGNQAMQRLLTSGGLQAKRRAGQSGDAVEHEADRAAEQARHSEQRPGPLIVEDDAPMVGPGQMRKTEFVTLLQSTISATADAVLESVGHTAKAGRDIRHWLDQVQRQRCAPPDAGHAQVRAGDGASAVGRRDHCAGEPASRAGGAEMGEVGEGNRSARRHPGGDGGRRRRRRLSGRGDGIGSLGIRQRAAGVFGRRWSEEGREARRVERAEWRTYTAEVEGWIGIQRERCVGGEGATWIGTIARWRCTEPDVSGVWI